MGHTPASSDAELVAAVRRERSESAFSVLYSRHTPRVYQTVWRILGGNAQESEDVMQEAWVRAVETLDAWRGGEAFGAWLRGIATHVAIDTLRRARRLTFDEDLDALAADPAGETIDLEAAIGSLAPGYRAVLVLHDVEGYTHEEIAGQLGITVGTSKGQLFKARRAVRGRLAPTITETA